MFRLTWHNWQMFLVGYCRPGAFPNHYLILLPWRPWYLCCLWCDRHGFFQQRQAVAPGNWSLCNRRCQQAACGQQERHGRQESCGIYRGEGMVYESTILTPWCAFWDHENWPGFLRNLPIAWESRSLRLPPKMPLMSNKLSWRWQDRLRSAWGLPPSTTSQLCRSAKARASSLALQADAAKFTNLLHTSPGIISAWRSVILWIGTPDNTWQWTTILTGYHSSMLLTFKIGAVMTDWPHPGTWACDDCWDLSSILFIIFLQLLSSPGFHPALDGLRLLSSCCFSYLFYLLWLLLVFFSFSFVLIFSTACLRLVAPIVFSRLGSMRVFCWNGLMERT